MTIPDDVIQRAAEAVHNASLYAGCECETCQQEALSAVRAALPILRDAIRAELVQEQVADAKKYGIDWITGEQIETVTYWLSFYLPESEPQP